jgi:pyruvate/2-oxoglutarate dehydrogenase complex dihydrolipoamide acyltransferase (E2) component
VLLCAAAVLTAAAPPAAAQTSAPAQKPPPAAPAESAGAPAPAAAPAPPQAEPPADTRGLDQDVQGLKKDVVDLNRDLFILEEELLFPANTQVAVFLSMDVGDFFTLDSVQLKIDQKEVINYLYTPREVEALLKGGVQRLYIGNLKVGSHELVAFFNGKGPNERPYKRGASIKFEKGIGAKYLELKIDDRQRKLQPEFEIKDWE